MYLKIKTTILAIFIITAVSQAALAANTAGTLTIKASTTTIGGEFEPNHIVAIWITNASNTFISSSLVYAKPRIAYLTNWTTASSSNKVNAITGATITSHGALPTCTWKGTDLLGAIVPDGVYTVKMEMTEDNATGKLATFSFTKGPVATTLTPSAQNNFTSVTLSWTPLNTGIEDVRISNLYTVFPTPTKGSVFINGPEVQQVEIFDLNGKSILKSNQQKMELGSLSAGNYLVQITTPSGTICKKIIKE